MNRFVKLLITSSVLAGVLVLSSSAFAFQTPPAKQAPAKTTAKAAPTPPPTDQQIADARTQKLVWVNLNTKVYHKDGEFYGKTKQGKFMAEPDAIKAGYRAAKDPAPKKKTEP